MKKLIIQVLGNSDVLLNGKEGAEALTGGDIETVAEYAKYVTEDVEAGDSSVDFPLIEQLKAIYSDSDYIYAILLTDQRQWIAKQDIRGSEWNKIIASDGIWWQSILTRWCQQNEITVYPLIFPIDENVNNGAADWEKIAKLLDWYFQKYLQVNNGTITFQPEKEASIPIEQIIIQHSSGTPALSGSLYLWGIEKKLAQCNVEFVYISRQDPQPRLHSGDHWQWRLKVPQIEQLLAIQDFTGVLQLIPREEKKLCKQARKLDRSVSFNLEQSGLNPRQTVIEKIAIALWSETAFRNRSQWMHWYLRVAGAFELALFCLVEKQGNNQYTWDLFSDPKNHNQPAKVVLKYKNDDLFRLDISKVTKELLINGNCTGRYLGKEINYTVSTIADYKWQNFREFYLNKGWELSKNNSQSFNIIRNDLYHSLQGETIDTQLDQKTQDLRSVTDPSHPSQIAINWLHYVNELAGLTSDVNEKVKFYEKLVEDLRENLYNIV